MEKNLGILWGTGNFFTVFINQKVQKVDIFCRSIWVGYSILIDIIFCIILTFNKKSLTIVHNGRSESDLNITKLFLSCILNSFNSTHCGHFIVLFKQTIADQSVISDFQILLIS
jgi:hypothetical protein